MRARSLLFASSLALASFAFAACAPAVSANPPGASDPVAYASGTSPSASSAPSAAPSEMPAQAGAPDGEAEMPAQTGAPDGEKIAGVVAVFADAELYTAPSPDAPRVVVAKYPGDAPRRAHPRGVVPLIVKKDRGAFIEVGLSPMVDELNVDMGCGDLSLELVGYHGDLAIDVGLFVRRADLAAMIVKPFAKRWDDGSSVELAPGALAAPVAGGFVAELGGFSRRLEGEVAIGHSVAALPKDVDGDPARFSLVRFDGLTLGGAPLPAPRWTFAPAASGAEARGERWLFPLQNRCSRVVLSTPANAVRAKEPAPPSSFGGEGFGVGSIGTRSGADIWVMPKGTSLACSLGGVRAELSVERSIGSERQDLCATLGLSVTSRYLFADKPGGKDVSFSCCAKASSAVLRKAPPTPGGLPGHGRLTGPHGAPR